MDRIVDRVGSLWVEREEDDDRDGYNDGEKAVLGPVSLGVVMLRVEGMGTRKDQWRCSSGQRGRGRAGGRAPRSGGDEDGLAAELLRAEGTETSLCKLVWVVGQ